ncbi:MAG: GTP cyclohydrolase FolE2 [Burkholderiaceae bacterium]
MKANDLLLLADVQGSADSRHLPIQKVGVRRLRHPMLWQAKDKAQATIGEFSFAVELPATKKGTHMSRFVTLLTQHDAPWSVADAPRVGKLLCETLEAERAVFEVKFALFVSKAAPVSGVTSLMDYEVTMRCEATHHDAHVTLAVLVPVTSLCPCSKEISAYGAHNQRSHITITAGVSANVMAEDIVAAVEAQASSELYGVLKRPDEKFVTERAYDNPKFVEDLVRDVALAMKKLPGLSNVTVEAENFESIHNHSAYAILSL